MKDYIREMGVMKHRYQQYMDLAEEFRNKLGENSWEEAQALLEAGKFAERMAAVSVGEEREFHSRNNQMIQQKVIHITDVLKEKNRKKTSDSKASAAAEKFSEDNIDISAWLKKEKPDHSFEDVAGMDSLKEKLRICADRAKRSKIAAHLKLPLANSFFFYGLPGSGKTYIVEAFANELMGQDFTFLSVEAKDILGRFVGESEKRVSRLFQEAVDKAPCIVFVDELDAVCVSRHQPGLSDHGASLTTAFLTGYNKLVDTEKEVIFIAATNYPDKVDNAMLSRMELIRVPLPDTKARKAYFEKKLTHIPLGEDITAEIMAVKTENYSFRNIGHIMDGVKEQIFQLCKQKYADASKAVEGLKQGEVRMTRAMFEKAYREYVPSPKDEDLRKLQAWEQEMRGKPEEKSTSEQEGKVYFDAENRKNGSEMAADSVLDPDPVGDIEISFQEICGPETDYSPQGDTWQETAGRFVEAMTIVTRWVDEEKRPTDALISWKNNAVKSSIQAASMLREKTIFMGFGESIFLQAYYGCTTVHQGMAVGNFGGTCGIIETCNMINQQTGSRLTEADGIRLFVEQGLCTAGMKSSNNGGTSARQRQRFQESFGLIFEVSYDGVGHTGGNQKLDLETVSERFRKGMSTGVILYAGDLSQEGLAPDRSTSGKKRKCVKADHAVTVTGFSYKNDGTVAGVWVNDCGGWAGYNNNRVYLTKEKYELMRVNTKYFSVEYSIKGGEEE